MPLPSLPPFSHHRGWRRVAHALSALRTITRTAGLSVKGGVCATISAKGNGELVVSVAARPYFPSLLTAVPHCLATP